MDMREKAKQAPVVHCPHRRVCLGYCSIASVPVVRLREIAAEVAPSSERLYAAAELVRRGLAG